MRKQISAIFATNTLRQSAVTFSGTVINGALGALFYILVARFLGPISFGLFSVAITVLTLIGDIGDLGTNTGLVRFVGKYLRRNPNKAKKFLKLGLEVKIAVSLLIIFVGFIFAPVISEKIFLRTELAVPLRFAFVGICTYLLFSYITYSFQAMQKFWWWSGLQVLTNFLRVVGIVFLLLGGALNLDRVMIVYILVPFLGFVLGVNFLPKNFFQVKNEISVSKEFFHYNKWVAAFSLVAAIAARLDIFISARLLSAVDLGLYSAAGQLVQIVPQIAGALGTVIAPKMAEMGNIKGLVLYLKKTQFMVLGIAFLGLASIPLFSYLIPILYGKAYLGSVPIFVILLIAMLVFLISIPIHNVVFYYFSKPALFFWLSVGHLAIIAFLGWYLILRFGAVGGAATVLVGTTFNFIVPAFWVIRKIK